jgi:hypothetical protein
MTKRHVLNGLAKKTGFQLKDADPDQLAIGIKVEMEHTDDPQIATIIALDHLAEYPTYYTALIEMEQHLESLKGSDL